MPTTEDEAVALVAALFMREYLDLLLLRCLPDLPDLFDERRRVLFSLSPGKSLIWLLSSAIEGY